MSHTDDLRSHQETWHGFIKLVGYSALGIAVLLGLMALFLL